jgi:hypothetical protein
LSRKRAHVKRSPATSSITSLGRSIDAGGVALIATDALVGGVGVVVVVVEAPHAVEAIARRRRDVRAFTRPSLAANWPGAPPAC